MNFSKTKYVEFIRCPKAAWLTAHKPEVRKLDSAFGNAAEAGVKLGELAKSYFGDYVDMTTYKPDGSLDLVAMAQKTQQAIADGAENICEAAFLYDGLYCAVDILHKAKFSELDFEIYKTMPRPKPSDNDIEGYVIYEVKSSSSMKDHYYYDIGYQAYVAEKCGVKILDCRVLHVNNEYVKCGEIDIRKLLTPNDKSKMTLRQIAAHSSKAPMLMLREAEDCLQGEEFDCIGKQCGDWCGYWEYCSRNLPKPNVFDLYNFHKKTECFENGIISFDDIAKSDVSLSTVQRRQIEYYDSKKGTYVDKEGIKDFLSTLSYPLYFLDFETMGLAIPEIDGTRPYEQIPFQYSLHYIEREGEEVKHREFLAQSGVDPRRELAERLCADIPDGVCTLAFHASTERGVIKALAVAFPDLSEKLLDIRSKITDLLPVFQKGYYYNSAMGGSFSIKSILPAVFPDMDYHNLEGVQNGTEAMNIFPKIKDMPPEEAQKTREQLLKYCELDTLAMVKLWQELVRVCK